MIVGNPSLRMFGLLMLLPGMLVVRREIALLAALCVASYTLPGLWLGVLLVAVRPRRGAAAAGSGSSRSSRGSGPRPPVVSSGRGSAMPVGSSHSPDRRVPGRLRPGSSPTWSRTSPRRTPSGPTTRSTGRSASAGSTRGSTTCRASWPVRTSSSPTSTSSTRRSPCSCSCRSSGCPSRCGGSCPASSSASTLWRLRPGAVDLADHGRPVRLAARREQPDLRQLGHVDRHVHLRRAAARLAGCPRRDEAVGPAVRADRYPPSIVVDRRGAARRPEPRDAPAVAGVRVAIRNSDAEWYYSLDDMPPLFIPVVAWLGRRDGGYADAAPAWVRGSAGSGFRSLRGGRRRSDAVDPTSRLDLGSALGDRPERGQDGQPARPEDRQGEGRRDRDRPAAIRPAAPGTRTPPAGTRRSNGMAIENWLSGVPPAVLRRPSLSQSTQSWRRYATETATSATGERPGR